MSDQPGGEAIFHDWIKQFTDALAEGKPPPSLLSPELVAPMLEMQQTMMHRLFDVFVEPDSGEAAQERKKEMSKALMACSLEMIKATREYRKNVLDAQSVLMERYLQNLVDATSAPTQGPPEREADSADSDARPKSPSV